MLIINVGFLFIHICIKFIFITLIYNTKTLKLFYPCSLQQHNNAIFFFLNADLVSISDVSSQAVYHNEGNICLIAAVLGGCFGVLRILFS